MSGWILEESSSIIQTMFVIFFEGVGFEGVERMSAAMNYIVSTTEVHGLQPTRH